MLGCLFFFMDDKERRAGTSESLAQGRKASQETLRAQTLNYCRSWEPPARHRGLPDPSGPEPQKSPKGCPVRGAPESPKNAPRSPRRVQKKESKKSPKSVRTLFGLFSDSFRTPWRTLWGLWGSLDGTPFRTLFGLFWGSGPEGSGRPLCLAGGFPMQEF